MFCKECGKETNSKAVVCVNCGCAISNKTAWTDQVFYSYILLGILLPIVGLLISIFNFTNENNRSRAITLLFTSTFAWIIYIIFIL